MNSTYIPYGRQHVDEDDIRAVVEVLKSDWLTTGPKVDEFEEAVCAFTGAEHGVAVSSGTAALHSAMYAIGIGPGDEVIVPTMTFAATANCVVYQGGRPVFADVEAETLLINPSLIEELITPKTKAIIAVDYAGQPCDYDQLREIADRHGLILVADACHSLGGKYKGRSVGTLADMTIFSFHPVKHITTGEGGMVVTDNPKNAARMRTFRNHGMSNDHHARRARGTWHYEIHELGFNYRISDIQCALGISQLNKAAQWLCRRQEIATVYDASFSALPGVAPLKMNPDTEHAYHLYVLTIDGKKPESKREKFFQGLAKKGIRAAVHYYPVHLQPLYRRWYQTKKGDCPVAENIYYKIVSLPIFPSLRQKEIKRIIETVSGLVEKMNE